MTEQDRQLVDKVRAWLKDDTNVWGEESTIMELVEIINRLDNQLTDLKETGGPIEDFIRYFPKQADDYVIAYHCSSEHIDDSGRLRLGQLRRLTQALKEVEDD